MAKSVLMTRRQLGSLARRVEDYERLLEDLSLRVGAQDQELIRKTMDNVRVAS